MFSKLNVTFEVTYGTTANWVVSKMQEEPKSRAKHRLSPTRPQDTTEEQLSPDILAMQRRIRRDKPREYNSRFAAGKETRQGGHAPVTGAGLKQEWLTKGSLRAATKDAQEGLDLKDVQPSDLDAMDFTGISPSLLAHPEGDNVEYSEWERQLIMAVYGRKASKHRNA